VDVSGWGYTSAVRAIDLPWALSFALALLSGCYLAHERGAPVGDAGVPMADAAVTDTGPICTFGLRSAEGAIHTCTIAVGSTESCAEAAMCSCAARDAGTPTEILACAGPDLTPRGALTFTDFCTVSPPERMSIVEAVEGLLGRETLVDPSPACASVPALLGARPFDHCGAIASELCRCVPGCDLDAALGRACLALSAEQADCIARRIFVTSPDCGFASELPALASRCGV
jgi:hypothetical protein